MCNVVMSQTPVVSMTTRLIEMEINCYSLFQHNLPSMQRNLKYKLITDIFQLDSRFEESKQLEFYDSCGSIEHYI